MIFNYAGHITDIPNESGRNLVTKCQLEAADSADRVFMSPPASFREETPFRLCKTLEEAKEWALQLKESFVELPVASKLGTSSIYDAELKV